jgi:hypothetical protein
MGNKSPKIEIDSAHSAEELETKREDDPITVIDSRLEDVLKKVKESMRTSPNRFVA